MGRKEGIARGCYDGCMSQNNPPDFFILGMPNMFFGILIASIFSVLDPFFITSIKSCIQGLFIKEKENKNQLLTIGSSNISFFKNRQPTIEYKAISIESPDTKNENTGVISRIQK